MKPRQKPRLEFFKIARIFPFHETNRLKDHCIRKDKIFDPLAEKIVDNPKILVLLSHKIKEWLRIEKSEFTYALAGYIYYCQKDFKKAEKFFFKAVNLNPENLDNWFDLAFCLYHQDIKRHRIAIKMFFNFDHSVKFLQIGKISLSSLDRFLEI